MTLYFLLKYLHVLGAIVILGTGTGIAFFMLMAHRTSDAEFIARTASVVVIADAIFTLSAVILRCAPRPPPPRRGGAVGCFFCSSRGPRPRRPAAGGPRLGSTSLRA